ncbi:MAG: hypothetical protein KGL13_10365 [Gammaproteobacteria bacterium]|nr:hypothetical protein [Gammaproteobacteria bacterium]
MDDSIGMNCTRGTSFTVRVIPIAPASGQQNPPPYVGLGKGKTQTIPIACRMPARIANVQESNSHAVRLDIDY